MASIAPECKSPSRPTNDEDNFTAPAPPDRNGGDQLECSSDEKCLEPKGPASQDEKLVPPSSVKSSQDSTTGEPKGMKESNWKIPFLPNRPSLASPSPTKDQKTKQDSQQQLHSQENSNGSEANPRKRPSVEDATDTTNSKGSGLPKELTAKFGPLTCDLCNVSVNSTVQARMHYIGKQHDKKVNQFLANWSRETGQPIPKRAKETAAAAKKAVLDPKDRYCNVCDLPLTSVQHAQQHYMGKNHLRAMQGRSPSNRQQQTPPGDAGGSGVGVPFSTDPLGLKDLPDAPAGKKGRFYCELCQVMATSQDQLDMHLKGAKHRKAEKAAGVATKLASWTGANVVACPTIPPPAASDSILASVIKTDDAMSRKPGIKDYSIYRTPSGDYYCPLCTVICNREDVFHSHMVSKKHAKHEKVKKVKEALALQGNDNAKEFLSNLKKTISNNVEKVSNSLFICKICDVRSESEEELQTHIETQEHKDKVSKLDPYICHVCNMSLESEEQLAVHCTQEEHKLKLQQDT